MGKHDLFNELPNRLAALSGQEARTYDILFEHIEQFPEGFFLNHTTEELQPSWSPEDD